MPFGNVNVSYSPCKAVGQLKAAELYMLGKKPEQIRNGVQKTSQELYTALGCSKDNFSKSILVTRKLNGKSYSRLKKDTILAHKMSISFHPKDNDKLSYELALSIATEFADEFFYSKGYEVLLAVHTDREHIHVHFLISNCNMETGKSFRRNRKDLYEMSEFFGEQCMRYGLNNSVRKDFYNHNLETARDKETLAEKQMKKRGAETFKDELREVIRIETKDENNRTFEDVIRALKEHYNVECRVAGNTVSYRHPEYKDKNGKSVSVRGSRLGEIYTRKGIEYELAKKRSIVKQSAAYGLDGSAERLERFVSEASHDERGRQTIGGGQIPGSVTVGNNGKAVQNLDEFYDRYRKRAEEDERRTAKTSERSGAVQKRNKDRSR